MEKDRGFRLVAVIALIIGVLGLSIGFAAFTATLNINSYNVSLDPVNTFEENINYVDNSATIASVACSTTGLTYTSEDTPFTTDSKGETYCALVKAGTAEDKDWSGITVTFRENATVVLNATVENKSQWIGYLKTITSTDGITCTAGTDTTQSYVDAICAGDTTGQLTVEVNVNGLTDSHKAGGSAFNKAATTNLTIAKLTGTNPVTVTITYNATQQPDGPVTVTIPTISFDYSTAPTVAS